MQGRKSLSATNLAVLQHLGCDLYIYNAYHRTRTPVPVQTSSLIKATDLSDAQFRKGLDWENSLLSWLDKSNLLLTVPSTPFVGANLLENIVADERAHFFIANLSFLPPRQDLDQRFREEQSTPVDFRLAKPDLLEITKISDRVLWRVVDIKASKHVKQSHHVQLYFYDLCLRYILRRSPFSSTDVIGVWLPPADSPGLMSPSMNDIKTVRVSLLKPSLDNLLFKQLPRILNLPRDEVNWHYNTLCQECPYEAGCRSRSVAQGEIGSMPNISLADARTLRDLLHVFSPPVPREAAERSIPDIEELHNLLKDRFSMENITKTAPALVRRAKEILSIPKKFHLAKGFLESPVVEAARSKQIQVIRRLNYSCPSREDIAVVISVITDPSYSGNTGNYFCITVHSEDAQISTPSAFLCSLTDVIAKLSNLIRLIEGASAKPPSCQFYVWSSSEHASLQSSLIEAATTSTSSNDDIRLCIGALMQDTSVLRTAFQPLLLSGALLDFLTKGKRTKVEYQVCLERMGLPTSGSAEVLRKRILNHIQKFQPSVSSGLGEHPRELGQLARIVVLKEEIERQLALPIPGYWDLPGCASLLLRASHSCPTDDQIFAAYKGSKNASDFRELLVSRNHVIYEVLTAFRSYIASQAGTSFLLNDAKVLSTELMDICKEPNIRKLFYMQQFEVLALLRELWRSRIEGCPEAPILQYCETVRGSVGLEYAFKLISGTIDYPASDSRDFALFDKLLVQDMSDLKSRGKYVPLEALFNDLVVSGVVFPLNKYTVHNWHKQDPNIQRNLLVADIRGASPVPDGQQPIVSLSIWGAEKISLQRGKMYRLSPRFVDFNTPKILSALWEIDLLWDLKDKTGEQEENVHHGIPFLQLITDQQSFRKFPMSEQYVKTEKGIQRLFEDLESSGNKTAASLILKASQHQACQKILSNELSIIWGPPGTGKTYTLSLSLLRLIIVERHHHGLQPKIVFVTANTHAAIHAFCRILQRLVAAHRSLSVKKWLDNVQVHIVSRGSDHPAPQRSEYGVEIYAGTMYQLYIYSKKHAIKIDCLVIDEASQVSLGAVSLVVSPLRPQGRIIIAGDPEQLAPILSAQYPSTGTGPLFGSVLDYLMHREEKTPVSHVSLRANVEESRGRAIQLVENFRLNADLGEFISAIYPCKFEAQKVQSVAVAQALSKLTDAGGIGRADSSTDFFAIRTFLIELAHVMLRKEGRDILIPPAVRPASNIARNLTDPTLPHIPVSLALIHLRPWSKKIGGIASESVMRVEAEIAAALVYFLRDCCPDDDIFVATPHRIQRDAVNTALRRAFGNEALEETLNRLSISNESAGHGVTVETIERLQGSEAPFVICLFSTPMSSPDQLGFLLERRRLNVAISRAKTLCIVISSDAVLSPPAKVLANETIAKGYAFLKDYQQRSWSYELPFEA